MRPFVCELVVILAFGAALLLAVFGVFGAIGAAGQRMCFELALAAVVVALCASRGAERSQSRL